MYSLEMATLNHIFRNTRRRSKTKNITRNNIPLYKLSDGGKCPDQEYGDLNQIYWNHFGCIPYDFIGDKEEKGKNAFQCASERMAHMKKLLKNNSSVDSKHIHPIKLAYDMGKTCFKNTLWYNQYVEKFKKYYDEMIRAYPETIPLFQTDAGTSNYPLEMEKKSIKNFINSKIKSDNTTNKHKNKTKNNSKQSSNKRNKTKKNVITHV
jgi:hypothetical protein